jgi:hypothetical protein
MYDVYCPVKKNLITEKFNNHICTCIYDENDLQPILAPHFKLEFSSAAGCRGTQFDRGGNFFVAPLPYQVYQAFSR